MSFTQSLRREARHAPDRVTVIDADGAASAAELVDRVARLAGGLIEVGVCPGDRVGILAHNSRHYLESILAIWWAGGVVNPINWRWSSAEIAYSLDDSQTRMVLIDGACQHHVDSGQTELGIEQVIALPGAGGRGVSFDELITSTPIDARDSAADSIAGIFYTGGTTGRSKGVMLSHRNLMTAALGAMATSPMMTPGGCYLHAAPMFHLGDFGASMMRLVAGGTHAMIPTFEAARVLDAVDRFGVTDVMLVPTMLHMVLEEIERSGRSFGSVRSLIYAGSPMPTALLDRAARLLPDVRFTQVYGMTELGPTATILTPSDHRGSDIRRKSAGKAALHCDVRVVGPDGVEAPPGVTGEVVCRGDNVMLGYLNRSEDTAEALRGGWMHTGDAGYFDGDGFLFIVDRMKDMIISGGENVYSSEVESALLLHPSVSMAAVVGLADERWGQRVHAFVVLNAERACTADELQAHARAYIAGYKVPRSFDFVDELPISAAGKVLKSALRSIATVNYKDQAEASLGPGNIATASLANASEEKQ